MSVRSSPMPNLMWGTDGVRVFTVDDAGAGYSPPSSIGTPSASGWMCASEATASPPFSRSPWGLRGVCLVRRCGAGAGLADGSRSQPVGASPTRSSSGRIQPSYAFVEQPQTNGVAERFNRTLKEQIIHGRIYRNIAELRNAVRGFVAVQCPVDRGEERLPEPRSSSSGVAHRDVTQARRMRQTCVQANRVRYREGSARSVRDR